MELSWVIEERSQVLFLLVGLGMLIYTLGSLMTPMPPVISPQLTPSLYKTYNYKYEEVSNTNKNTKTQLQKLCSIGF